MAIKKIRIRPEGGNDYGDVLHPETSADQVKISSGGTVEDLKTDLGTHLAEKATQNEYGHIRLQDIPTPTKASVGLGNVDNVKQMPISGGILENYREKLGTITEFFTGTGRDYTLDLSTGNVFKTNVGPYSKIIIENAQQGVAHSFTLVTERNGLPGPVYYPSSVKWQGGEIPDLTNYDKTYVLTFVTVDGGETWLGMFGGEF